MIWWKKAIIIFVVFIGFIFLFNSVIMPWYVRHDTLVKVPSVIGMKYEDAVKVLDDADLEGLQGDVRYDGSKPIGTILDQNPPADQMVKDGRRIYLIVSGGERCMMFLILWAERSGNPNLCLLRETSSFRKLKQNPRCSILPE